MKAITAALFFWGYLCVSLCLADSSHKFVYQPPAGQRPSSVDLAGTFNNWSMDSTPMRRQSDGSYAVTLSLPDGVYQYKFVIDGQKWVSDPKSDKALEEPGDSNNNSAVLVGPDAREAPAPEPNQINGKWVLHDPDDVSDVNVATTHLLRLRLRTQANDVDEVIVHFGPAPTLTLPRSTRGGNRETGWRQHRMYKTGSRLGLDSYSWWINTDLPVVDYYFELRDGTADEDLTDHGIKPRMYMRGYFRASMTPKFTTPDWAKNAVWYQIFPERFRNGDKANDPPGTQRWQSKWYSVLPGETPGMKNFYTGAGNVWKRRYGGDIQGLIWALPYLKKLGITTIYLNPMFESPSLHKYDTSDYRHIDEHFGFKGDIEKLHGETDDPATWQWTKTDKLFLSYLAKAHAMGFHVIIDGVFNHVGRDFWAFQDVLKNGKKSKYAGWFDIRDWGPPIKYIAWDTGSVATSHGAMPIFKKDPVLGLVHGPRELVLNIARRWLAPDGDPSRGVDGFRLDVANEVPHPFWVEFRKVVKSTKPSAYITGEIWTMAQPWLKGDQFDAVMNYPFLVAMRQFYVDEHGITASAFNDKLNSLIYAYPLQISLDQMNLLDSHDTDRFASMIVNDRFGFKQASRLQDDDNARWYSTAKPDATQIARMEQALVTQFTFVGAPMIYYGDEAGMWGADDPSNRQPMIWKDLEPYDDPQVKFNQQLFDWYQRLIAIRESEPALRTGFYRPVVMDDKRGVFVYARDLGKEHVYVVINRSAATHTVSFTVDPALSKTPTLTLPRGTRGGDNTIPPLYADGRNIGTSDSRTTAENALTPSPGTPGEGRGGGSAISTKSSVDPKNYNYVDELTGRKIHDDGRVTLKLGAYGSAILAPAN